MKKGMLLSLMMVVLVALAGTSFAVAPIIQELPTVVVGDNEDVATGGLHLMRYLNAFNIASKITRSNGYDLNKLHVYYADDGTGVIKPSTTGRIVQPLSAGEVTGLGSGTLPADAKEITDVAGNGGGSDFYWMSLINDAINQAAGTPATDAYSADAAVNGVAQASYPAGSTGAKTLTLYAVDGDDDPTTPSLVANGDFVVYSTASADDGFAGGVEEVYSASGTGLNSWNNKNSGVTPGTSGSGPTLTASGTGTGVGYWQSGTGTALVMIAPVTEAGVADKIFRLQATLGSTAATAVLSPHTRLFFFSKRYHHSGGLILRSLDNGTDTGDLGNIPFTGNDKTLDMYWAAPMETTQMSDTGALANVQDYDPLLPTEDARGYCLEWRVMDTEAADAGMLTLKSVAITKLPRPADVTPILHWGTGNTAFNDASAGFTLTTTPPSDITNPGTGSVGAANAQVGGGTAGDGYASVAPSHAGTGAFDLVNAQLVRARFHLSTSSANATPNVNTLLYSYKYEGGIIDSAHRRVSNQTYFSIIGSVGLSAGTGSLKGFMMVADGVPPCNPTTTGSWVEVYYYTNSVGGADPIKVVPQVAASMRANRYGGPSYTGASDYPKEDATVTVDEVTVEDNVL